MTPPPLAGVLPGVLLGGVVGAAASLTLSAALRAPIDALLGAVPGHGSAPSALGPLLESLLVAGLLNMTGAFALGLLRGRSARAAAAGRPWDARVMPAVGTGLLGSFTSFSALSLALAPSLGAGLVHGGETTASPLPVLGTAAGVAALGTMAAAAGLVLGRGPQSHAEHA